MAKKKTKKKKLKQSHSTVKTKPTPAAPTPAPQVVPYPAAGKKVTEFENRLDEALGSADQMDGKRGRGRPRKEPEPEPVQIDDAIIAQAIQIPFDLWAVSQDCEQLKISMPEARTIAKPLKQLLDYYMPNVPEIAWAWIALSAAGYSIVKSRLVIIAEIKKQKSFSSPSSERADGEQGVPERREHGGSRSLNFPTIKEIKEPVT